MARLAIQREALATPGLEAAGVSSYWQRLRAVVTTDTFASGLVALAIVVGFFHGWLKFRFKHPLVTFLFDGLLLAALGTVALQSGGGRLFPRNPVASGMQVFLGMCTLYLLLPFGPPFLLKLAAWRGWCFPLLVFCLGYKLTRNLSQVHGYFYVLILLGLATALYGARQTPEEVEAMMRADPDLAKRLSNTFYTAKVGSYAAGSETTKNTFRVFSTFVSAAGFGGTMAYVLLFVIVLFTEPGTTTRDRMLLVAAGLPIAYGLVISGARTSLIQLGVGFLLVSWYRRSFFNFIMIPAIVVLAIQVGISATGGAALSRYQSLLDVQAVWERNYIPLYLGYHYMEEAFLGHGIGSTGYSVPFFIVRRLEWFEQLPAADGDLGRVMIEFGLPGLMALGFMLWAIGRTTYGQLQVLRSTKASSVALASACCFVMSVASLPSGSPFLGIPMGAMTWFLIGTLNKLYELNAAAQRSPGLPRPPQAPPDTRRFAFRRQLPQAAAPRQPRFL